MLDRLRGYVARRPIAALLIALGVGVLTAGAVGGAIAVSKSGQVDDLEGEVSELSASLDEAEAERASAEATAARITERKDEILGDAQERASTMVSDAEDKVEMLGDELAQAQDDLASTETKLADVEASLGEAQETQQLSSFGDGIWESGTDFLPGTYRAAGGGGCYWALLGSADTSDIINNGGFSKNQTLTIDSPYFETSDCGTWERIGE